MQRVMHFGDLRDSNSTRLDGIVGGYNGGSDHFQRRLRIGNKTSGFIADRENGPHADSSGEE